MFNLILVALFGSFVFIAPVRYDWDQIYCFIGMMGIVVLSWFFEKRRTVSLRTLGLCFLWALFTLITAFRGALIYVLFNVFIGVMALKAIAETCKFSMAEMRRLGTFLFWFSVASSVYLFFQKIGMDPLYLAAYRDIGATFGKPWVMGCFAAMAAPFIWDRKPIYTLALIPMLLQSHSSVCVLAAVASIGYLILNENKWLFVPITLGALVVAAVIIRGEGGIESHRLHVWANIWPLVNEKLLLGHGLGSFKNDGFVHQVNDHYEVWVWLHNEFYQHIYEQGIMGLGLLIAWITSLWIKADVLGQSALISICTLSLFHPMMHWGKLLFFAVFILAYAESMVWRQEKNGVLFT